MWWVIFILFIFGFRIGLPIIIIAAIIKALRDKNKGGPTKPQNGTYKNKNSSLYTNGQSTALGQKGGSLSDYCKKPMTLNDYVDEVRKIEDDELFRQSQAARKEHLQSLYGDQLRSQKAEKAKSANKTSDDQKYTSTYQYLEQCQMDDIFQNSNAVSKKENVTSKSSPVIEAYDAPVLTPTPELGSSSTPILDSAFESSFDYKFDSGFDTSFGSSFDMPSSSVFSYPTSDPVQKGEESFVDSLLKEYGVEKKVYDWEKKDDE